eukprot:CAMPEP_0197648224 /NCGR_PEP_ID=MMETSP1338-20131121/27629_1 /TAXON_ID=43686 ORGANISM="Pelagodinium beii, Strain RCC1491" /NCGR_SAMPLE_ID=MMETSP1338 /ASSEMBLY_ACC=CAM_ASM_000754 /LENGTH=127 /DNA_ID=CAMNT_0043222189 /DNA_START=112 /DNA_END=495 /DNA_ORIENTATION=-
MAVSKRAVRSILLVLALTLAEGAVLHLSLVQDSDASQGRTIDNVPPATSGSWTAPRDVTQDDIAKWEKVKKKNSTNSELQGLDTPEKVSTQVVAGTNYKFIFSDNTEVTVFEQVWTDTLQVTQVKRP